MLPIGDELAGRVVDSSDVVGVEGVSHPERVGEHAHPDVVHGRLTEREVVRDDEAEQHAEADHVQEHDEAGHPEKRAPVLLVQRSAEPGESALAASRWHVPTLGTAQALSQVIGNNAHNSTWEAMTTVRSSGRQK